MKTKMVNILKEPYDVYCGRAGKGHDGYFGNPFPLMKGEPKGSTLPRYRKYFYDRLKKDEEFKKRVLELKGKTLGCFCSSVETCHTSVIIEYLDGEIKGTQDF